MSLHRSLLAVTLLLPTFAHAQVTAEIEPNESKAQADSNGTILLAAGDKITGTSTGNLQAPGLSSIDYFRIKTAPLAAGIYKHALTITTTGGFGHNTTLRGLAQVAGSITPGSDEQVQLGITVTGPARALAWYGFGRGEELYVTVAGGANTTGTYEATLTTSAVTIGTVPGAFANGAISINTMGLTGIDTELFIYDATFQPVPTAHNDDQTVDGTTTQSRLVRILAPGTYYLVISDYNTCNNRSDANPDEDFDDADVLDFPDALAASDSETAATDLDFSITDSNGTTNVTNVSEPLFGIKFWRFVVAPPVTPPVAYCFGDGSGTACPCGNAGAAGNGCASSVNANGANLAASGLQSISADSLVLSGSGMPSSSALYYQGTTQSGGGAGTAFGDGLRCAGGSVIRLGTKTNVGGASQYPAAGDQSISVRGLNTAGASRTYQCWYRNSAAFCTPSTFNLTNGVALTWIL